MPTVSMSQLLCYLETPAQNLLAFTVSDTAGILLLFQHNVQLSYKQSYNGLMTHTSIEGQLQTLFLCLYIEMFAFIKQK